MHAYTALNHPLHAYPFNIYFLCTICIVLYRNTWLVYRHFIYVVGHWCFLYIYLYIHLFFHILAYIIVPSILYLYLFIFWQQWGKKKSNFLYMYTYLAHKADSDSDSDSATREVFNCFVLSGQQSKTQNFIYCHIWQRKTAKPHSGEAGTSKRLVFLLENDWND